MDPIIEFFKKLFDSSDWPPRWHCGHWTEFHGWLYIISDLLIWTAYFSIPVVIIRYISKRQDIRFARLYFLFAAFILACGTTHFLDAVAFWIPAYRLSALVRLITGILSWVTVFSLVKLLPTAFSLKSQKELEAEIVQRKKAEEQAKENEERVQAIFKAAPDAVIVIDNGGVIVNWNPRSETLFGWTADEVLGKKLSETIIPFRYREAHEQGLEHFLKTGEGPVLGQTIEIQAVNKDNIEFDVALSISPTIVKDKHLFIGFVRDITERRQAEHKIQKQKQDIQDFIDSMSTLCAKVSTEGKLLLVNKAALLASGLSMEELLGTNFLEGKWWTYDPAVHARASDAFESACAGKAINYDENIFVFEQVLSINFSLIPILKPDGGVDYLVAEARDISLQKKAEASLARLNNELEQKVKERTEEIYNNEKRFRTLIENSNEVIIICDMQGNRLFVSGGIKRMLGYTPEEFMKFSIFNMLPPEEAQSFRLILQKIIDNPHQPFTTNVRIQHKNGPWRWIEAVMAAFLDVPGLNGIVINYRDVTERIEAEENRKATLKEIADYKYALDESSIVAITDQKGIIKYVNNNFCKISKYSREELIGQDHRIINSGYHAKEFIRNLWVTIANGKIWRGELKNKAKDDTIYWVDTTIVPFLDEAGKPYQYVAIRADITERKQTEQALHESRQLLSAIIDNSQAVIYVKDLQGHYLLVNRRFSELFHRHQEDILGKTDYDFFPKKEADAFRDMDIRTAAANQALTEEEMAPQDDGLHTYISVKSTLRDDKGRTYAIFGISTDITDRKKAENEIQKLNEKLEQKVIARTAELESVNKEMEAFSYSVSHDLRGPLRGIIGFTTILEEDYSSKLDDEAKRITSVIKSNTIKMGQLIDDLLAFSRMRSQDIIKTRINISEMVKEVINSLDIKKDNRNIKWVIGSLPVINGDIQTIRQVWVNLISNAIKYSENKEQPYIEIGSFSHEGQIAFFVKDNGVGFDKKYKDKLFKVFQRLHSNEEFEGTGVGLAIIEKIISKHGGKVWAESEVNEGASFYFSLPA